ncbi:response regulator transcription factor [Puniceicoccaceae bacterium K14]|nr:response regulator transcription factor [Puniceicoccaceae bacterium K14]
MRILVVEDNPVLQKQLKRSLREQAYAVDTANDGEEGIYKLENWPYDLVVLDVNLPGIDGFEVLRRLRKTKETPVILLTARDEVYDRVNGLDFGADDFLGKPFEMNELLARIRSILRRSRNSTSPNITIGDIQINMNTGKVFRGDEEVALTSMEYSILLKLSSELGKIISTQELLDAVLDENDDSMSNSLNVHIFNIRKKLGKDSIKTVRGRGYFVE